MNGQVQQVEEGIKELLRCCPEWKERAEFLCSVPGVWPMLCATVIARLPQLGQLNRKEIAALAGLAPFNRDSGTLRGSARCAGHAPVPPPWPLPSSPEPAGGWRTIVPARGASAPGSSAAQILDSHLPLFQRPVYLPHAHHHPSQLLRPAYIVHPQIYPITLRISPWLWFSCGEQISTPPRWIRTTDSLAHVAGNAQSPPEGLRAPTGW